MKLKEKQQIIRCWRDVQHAVSSAHAKINGVDSWEEFLAGKRGDKRTGFGPGGGIHLARTLNDHAGVMNNRDARDAISQTLEEVIFSAPYWSQGAVYEIQKIFQASMGPLYEEASRKKGYRIVRHGFGIEYIEWPSYLEELEEQSK